ncbi:hypothetical protein [Bacillus mojavensis]
MKTSLTMKELRELSDSELVNRYYYAYEKYRGRDVHYELSNIANEIIERFVQYQNIKYKQKG